MNDGSIEQVIKLEYEVMHTSVEELSRSHNVPVSVINAYIKEGSWQRVEVKDDDQRLDLINDQLTTMSTFNQALLTRRFLSLQNKVLDVAHHLLDQVDSISDAQSLKIVSEVIELHRPHILGKTGGGQEGGQGEGLKIQVISQFGSESMTNAVHISETAGQSNGVGAVTRAADDAIQVN
ncbi:MAG: hypothetical protein ACPKM1_15625 [Spirochaetaceae bacterium]